VFCHRLYDDAVRGTLPLKYDPAAYFIGSTHLSLQAGSVVVSLGRLSRPESMNFPSAGVRLGRSIHFSSTALRTGRTNTEKREIERLFKIHPMTLTFGEMISKKSAPAD
jgi:hypothetical protein